MWATDSTTWYQGNMIIEFLSNP